MQLLLLEGGVEERTITLLVGLVEADRLLLPPLVFILLVADILPDPPIFVIITSGLSRVNCG